MKKSVIAIAAVLFIVFAFPQLSHLASAENFTLPPPPPPPSTSGLHSGSSSNLTNFTFTNYTSNTTSNITIATQTPQSSASNTIASLNAEILTLRQEIARLNATIQSDQTEINRLNQQIANLQLVASAAEQPAPAKTSGAKYILIASVVILFLIVAVFVAKKIFKKSNQQPARAPDHRTEVLKQYISLNRNIPLQSLKQDLVAHGWPPEEVDRAAAEAGYV